MKRPAVKGADRVDMTTKSGSGPCNRLIKLKSPMIMPNTYLWSPLGSGKRCQVFTQIFKVIWIIFFQLRGKGMKIIGGGKMCCSLELKQPWALMTLFPSWTTRFFFFFPTLFTAISQLPREVMKCAQLPFNFVLFTCLNAYTSINAKRVTLIGSDW